MQVSHINSIQGKKKYRSLLRLHFFRHGSQFCMNYLNWDFSKSWNQRNWFNPRPDTPGFALPSVEG